MEACTSVVPTILFRNSTKQYLNPSCPSTHSAIFNKNGLSTSRCCFLCSCSSASHLVSRRKVQAVKPTGALSSSRGSLSASLDSVGTSSSVWMPRPEDLDTTNMLLRQRIVFLGSQVDDVSADFIISQLLLLDLEDSTKDIKLFINSPGGSVTAGMGIYDAMKLCKADISTVCFGLAASMGAFLLASGTRGKRFCMPNAKVMIHQPLGGGGGSAIEMALQAKELMYHKIKLTKIMSRLTNKSEEQVAQDTDRDYFLNPWEAVEYGLADAVIDDGKPGLVAPIGDTKPPSNIEMWHYWSAKDWKEKKRLPSEEYLIQKGTEEGSLESSDKSDSKQLNEGAVAV